VVIEEPRLSSNCFATQPWKTDRFNIGHHQHLQQIRGWQAIALLYLHVAPQASLTITECSPGQPHGEQLVQYPPIATPTIAKALMPQSRQAKSPQMLTW